MCATSLSFCPDSAHNKMLQVLVEVRSHSSFKTLRKPIYLSSMVLLYVPLWDNIWLHRCWPACWNKKSLRSNEFFTQGLLSLGLDLAKINSMLWKAELLKDASLFSHLKGSSHLYISYLFTKENKSISMLLYFLLLYLKMTYFSTMLVFSCWQILIFSTFLPWLFPLAALSTTLPWLNTVIINMTRELCYSHGTRRI